MEALDAELKVNIRDSMYCYLWDEFILKKVSVCRFLLKFEFSVSLAVRRSSM